jgi:hypothetical protein
VILVLILVGVLVLVVVAVVASRRQPRGGTPVAITEIAAAVDGERVTVQGRIADVTLSSLTSHLTGETAVCSQAELTYHHQGSRVVETRREVPFRVVDDTGEAYVSIKGATVSFGDRTAETRLDGGAITGWARQALEDDGLTFSGTPAGHLDVVERLLAPGDTVTVMGIASSKVDPADPARRHVVILPDPELGVVVSGDPITFG